MTAFIFSMCGGALKLNSVLFPPTFLILRQTVLHAVNKEKVLEKAQSV